MELDRAITITDYRPTMFPMLGNWWRARETEPPPREILPRLGWIAQQTHTPAAAVFLYLDGAGSGASWLAFPTTSPHVSRRIGTVALAAAVGRALFEARAQGATWCLGSFGSGGMVRFMARNFGFRIDLTGETRMIKNLENQAQERGTP